MMISALNIAHILFQYGARETPIILYIHRCVYTAFCVEASRTAVAAFLDSRSSVSKQEGRKEGRKEGENLSIRYDEEWRRSEGTLVQGAEPASRHHLVSTNLHDDNDEPFRYTRFLTFPIE